MREGSEKKKDISADTLQGARALSQGFRAVGRAQGLAGSLAGSRDMSSSRKGAAESSVLDEGKKADAVAEKVQAAKLALKNGRSAGKTGKLLSSLPFAKLPLLILSLILFLSFTALLSTAVLTSQAQFDQVFCLTPLGAEDSETRSPEDKQASVYDKDLARESTLKLLSIVDAKKAEDRETQLENLKNEIKKMNCDVELSLEKLEEFSEAAGSASGSGYTGCFSLQPFSEEELSVFPAADKTSAASWDFDICLKEGYFEDENGFCRYQAEEGEADYVVKMPAYFGSAKNRYQVTFTDGTVISVVKVGDAAADEGILQTAVCFTAEEEDQKDCEKLPWHGKKISEVKLAESDFAEGTQTFFSQASNRLLAAFSVAMDNGRITKEGPGRYVNSRGISVSPYLFGERAGEINYEKSLKMLLDDYTASAGNHFYRTEYEMKDGSIRIYTKKIAHWGTRQVEKTDPETGQTYTATEIYTWYEYKDYVHPYLIEKDTESMAEEIFALDADEPYFAGEFGTGLSTGDAINQIAQATYAILMDVDVSSSVYYMTGFSGIYEWPAPGNFRVTSQFGYRFHPVTHVYSMHTGIDIAGDTGSPAVSAESGTVTFAGYSGTYGNMVEITHGGGVKTRYAHLSVIAAYAGQSVSRGQQIGLIGSSGRATGPHLHFEVRVSDSPAEPLSWILDAADIAGITIE